MSDKAPLTLSRKLTRLNLLVSAAALLMACSAFVAYDLITFREIIVRNLSVQAQLLGSNSIAPLTFGDPDSVENTLSALQSAASVVAACVYTADGRPFARYIRGGSIAIPAEAVLAEGLDERQWFEHGQAMLIRRVVFQNETVGYIFIESDLQAVAARFERYLLISVVVLLISMAAAVAASAALRREIMTPLERLAEVARHVSQGHNYTVRASTEGAPADVAFLIGTFNDMLGTIEQRDRELLSARDDLENRVMQRTAELAAANKELESFSYSVSHDLRAPLRSIDGFSVALLEDYGDRLDAEGRGYFERIRAATRRMGQLIDDMLELARVTRAEMQRERVDLTAIARNIEADIRKSDTERKVDCVIGDGIEAVGDIRLLRVVMDNLLRNAWKYTSKHPTARIEFNQIRNNGDKPVYFVKDDGAGFDPNFAGKLFGVFQRLHGAAEFAGTGVGLATVARIVQRHGGRVWAESQVEQGATFYFVL